MDPDKAAVGRLRRRCLDVRRDIIEMIYAGGSGHAGGSLSAVEVLVALYFHLMRIRPEEPDWPQRDRFILSKGHAAPALYAVLAERGFFPVEELKTFSAPGTRLQKHVDMHRVPGTEVSSGSLGQGLSIAIGMALADRMDSQDRYVYVLIGDGESQEGQIWEATLAASHLELERIVAFIDNNRLQVDGFVRDIIKLEPIGTKWQSFGWHVQRVDGHDVRQILAAVETAKRSSGQPHMIIADTVKGKGISYMENSIKWHSHPISEDEYRTAMADLQAIERALAEDDVL